jgi:hypothetical protein
MSAWLEIKYLKQISSRLSLWTEKKVSPHMSICKCPQCGDSQSNKRKRRGYFLEKEGSLFFYCHNCSYAASFYNFLKQFDPFVFKQFVMEKYQGSDRQERVQPKKIVIPKQSTKKKSILDDLPKVIELDDDHIAKQYIMSRKLPEKHNQMFYYAESFFKWASSNTDKFEYKEGSRDHPRIIIPWLNENKEIFGYQARSINGEDPKYYTILLDEHYDKVFGMDRVDTIKKIYCVEGPIDSLCIPNCVAVGSSALTTFDDSSKKVVFVWDNERRNKEIVKMIGDALRSGKSVFIPPETYFHKDLNEALQHGMMPDALVKMIDENTYQGASGIMKLNKWKRS